MVGTSNLGSWNGHWWKDLKRINFTQTQTPPGTERSDFKGLWSTTQQLGITRTWVGDRNPGTRESILHQDWSVVGDGISKLTVGYPNHSKPNHVFHDTLNLLKTIDSYYSFPMAKSVLQVGENRRAADNVLPCNLNTCNCAKIGGQDFPTGTLGFYPGVFRVFYINTSMGLHHRGQQKGWSNYAKTCI